MVEAQQGTRTNGHGPLPLSPSGPQLERPKRAGSGGSPSPVVIIAASLAAGYVLAKAIDWRGHAHPRR